MSERIRTHLHTNVVGYIAIFLFAMGGTAFAIHPGGNNTIDSADIINGQVLTQDIGADEVQSGDIAPGSINNPHLAGSAVTSAKVANNNLIGADIQDETLDGDDISNAPPFGPAGGGFNGDVHIQDGTILGFDVASNTLGGGQIAESTLTGLGGADGFDSFCDPASTTFIDCDGAATVTLNRTMNVLVIATSHFDSFGAAPAIGNCRLERNDVAVSNDHTIGELDAGDDTSSAVHQGGMNLVDLQSLAAGTYTFEVSCNETDSDIEYRDIRVAAVELSQE